MTTFGLVVPFFSNEKYLQEMLKSIVAQTSDQWVCLVIDDSGRSNEAESIVRSLGDPKITYIKNETNLGLGRCWNTGLEYMIRTFDLTVVAVVHADDVLEPEFVEVSLAGHTSSPGAVAVHTAVTVVDEHNKKRFSFPDFIKFHVAPYKHSRSISTTGDKGLASILRGNFVFCPTVSFKTNLISLPLFDSNWTMAVDLDLISRLLLQGQTIIGIPDFVYRYRRHRSNLTSQLTDTSARFIEEIYFYKKISSECAAIGFVQSTKMASRMTMVRLHILYRLLQKMARMDLSASLKLIRVFRSTRSTGAEFTDQR
jgi:glycosyltransferase involved in cell wall biosynthesis